MPLWTDSARLAFERHLETTRPGVIASGADPDEVAADLRRHLDAELAAAGIETVTGADVARLLGRIAPGVPAEEENIHNFAAATALDATRTILGISVRFAVMLFGVVLPLITLVVELVTGMARDIFFDPIPTWAHAAAIALVPVSSWVALRAISSGRHRQLRNAARANAVATGVAFVYALWFIPMLIPAVPGIIFFGLGFLPLSPLLSLLVLILLRCDLRRAGGAVGLELPRVWAGFGVALLALVALESPGYLTARAADQLGGGKDVSPGVMRWLSFSSSEKQLLQGCYSESDARREVWAWLGADASGEDYRLAYYRVTGRPFNEVPRPESWLWGTRSSRGFSSRDEDQGEQHVGQRQPHLSLKSSALDGSLDVAAALGYLEWTLVFRNDHEWQQGEARAVVQLPAGAAVSRLTLWVHGEEREAAFAGRGQVTEAYRNVVRQRRDPVLVTSVGADRVLVQCFPIESKGGEMKVRLGITLPLHPGEDGRLRHGLPQVIEKNFNVDPELKHALWLEAKAPINFDEVDGVRLRDETTSQGEHAVRGDILDEVFYFRTLGFSVAGGADAGWAWVPARDDPARVVVQRIVRAKAPAETGPLAIVIEGSRGLAEAGGVLAEALGKLPDDFPVRVWIATDRPQASDGEAARAARWLRAQTFAGGQDSLRALVAAHDELLAKGGGTLLWIHGAQPYTWHGMEVMRQALTRRPGAVRIVALAGVPGTNLPLRELSDFTALRSAALMGDLSGGVEAALADYRTGRLMAQRTLAAAADYVPEAGVKRTSDHLWRLWALDEVGRRLERERPDRDGALKLAVAAQLVTPVSGAVVLETAQQYEAAGLEPVSPNTVPTIPEPATLLLIVVAGGALAVLIWRERRRARTGSAVT